MSPYRPSRYSRRDVLKWGATLPLASLAAPVPALARQATPAPSADTAIDQLVAGNTAFAFDLYAALRGTVAGNLLVSPYSISQALAMTWAGARGETAAQMEDVLSFMLPEPDLHESFSGLNADLVERGNPDADADDAEDPRTLAIANALWVEQTYPLVPAYTALLEQYYGSVLHQADFRNAPEAVREEINSWVEDQTEDRIQDIVGPGDITRYTVLVLANAIYFYGLWRTQFDPHDTHEDVFHLLDGTVVTVPFMTQVVGLPHAQGDGYQAIEFPYADSGFAMTVLLPDDGHFAAFEAGLDPAVLEMAVGELVETGVDVSLPKFTFTLGASLAEPLMQLGMTDAFDPEHADFTGMVDGTVLERLYISDVFHEAFIEVDEKGAEAAAATTVHVGSSPTASAPPLLIRIDRPFLFAIRDTVTRTILFLGRVLDPSA